MATDPKVVPFPAPASPPASSARVREPHLRALKIALSAAFSVALLSTLYLLLADVPVQFRLDCDRGAGGCWAERETMFSRRVAYFPVQSLRDVRVRTFQGLRGAPRVVLIAVTDSGRMLVAEYSAAEKQAAEADAAQVRLFLSSNQPELRIAKESGHSRWLAIAVFAPALLLLAALWWVLLREM